MGEAEAAAEEAAAAEPATGPLLEVKRVDIPATVADAMVKVRVV